jgi:formylglycine-generating enzyme required for sulfatase activity
MTTDVMVTMERLPVYISDDVDNYPCLKKYLDLLCKIPGGTFEMGGNSYEREQPLHKVTVSTYFLGATPVTNDMWDEYCNDVGQTANKSHTVGTGDHPVVNVSWDDIMGAEGYCQWASSIAGINLVLPTEAQFEHAARGNLVGKPFPWGVTFNDDFLWCSVINKRTETAEVNRSHNIYVNSYGLSDLVGNVWEWCLDWYAPYTECDKIDPMGPENPIELSRSIRGGSYIYHYPVGFRCATRNRFNPSRHDRFIGFRIACTIADEFNQKTASFTSSLEELASIEPQTTDLVAER